MARILLIEPDPDVRAVLGAQLAPVGHEVVEAGSGEAALELARDSRFDLVVLEILLPGLHGFETAAQLRRTDGNGLLPIIVVSSLRDPSSRTLALRSGVDEFFTRPIDVIELRARVESLLVRRREREELLRTNAELIDLHRLKEEMSTALVGELRNPLSTVLANLEQLDALERDGFERAALIWEARLASARMLRMLSNLLDLSRIEARRFTPRIEAVRVAALLDVALAPRRAALADRGLMVAIADSGVVARVDRDLFVRVLENLLDNALRYCPDRGRIVVRTVQLGHRIQIRIGNDGPPIPIDERQRLFEKYERVGAETRLNLGLGLYFCRLAIESLRGQISVEQEPRLPTVFVIDLPSP